MKIVIQIHAEGSTMGLVPEPGDAQPTRQLLATVLLQQALTLIAPQGGPEHEGKKIVLANVVPK